MTFDTEQLLESLCKFSIVWILVFQGIGLLNLFTGSPPLRAPWIFFAAALSVSIWLFGTRPRLPAGIHFRPHFRFAGWLLGGTYGAFLCDSLFTWPNGYDAIYYHLMYPVTWTQNASFRLVDLRWNMSLPANAELFSLPAIAVNSQSLVFLGNILATAILALSVYLLGFRVSGSKRGAQLGVIIALSMPLVIFQTFYFNVDVFGTAFLFAALVFLLGFAETGSGRAALLCSLCCGISIGTKHVFIPYAGLVLLSALIVAARQRHAIFVILLVLAAASPLTLWVCRNVVATGNPAYPFPVRFAGVRLRGAYGFPPFQLRPSTHVIAVLAAGTETKGPPHQPAAAPPSSAAQPAARIDVNEDRGVGPCFAIFSAAGILAVIWESFRKPRAWLVCLTIACACLGSIWWIVIPVPRFGLPVFVLVSVFCSLLSERLALLHDAIVPAFLTAGLIIGSAVCLAVPAHRIVNRELSRDWSRAAYYGYPSLLDRLAAGASVLDRSSGERMGFAFAGSRLSNKVIHLEGPFTYSSISQNKIEYAVKEGRSDQEDSLLREYGDLVYDGVPSTIFPSVAIRWRIYRMR